MTRKNPLIAFIGFIAASMMMLGVPVPASAGMIGTPQHLQQTEQVSQLDKVSQFISRDDVRTQMLALGVSPDAADVRIAALTTAELENLSQYIDQAPAGGDGLFTLLGVVFIVLLVLELVGVLNLFTAI